MTGFLVVAESTLERWPRRVGEVLVEPATGVVRVRRPRESPLTVTPDDARWLAEQPCTPERVAEVLAAAADEADRQAEVLLELLESRAADGGTGPRRHGGY